MILRVVRKETKNYDSRSDDKCKVVNSLKKNELTFGEILTNIKLLKTKKIKKNLNIKRYKRINNKFIEKPVNIYIREAESTNENELIEDMYIYNQYIKSNEEYNNICFNDKQFNQWKKEHENYFFPSLNAPWQVRRIFRVMEENLGVFEKERFLNLKFELWIYVNRPMILQEKVLDIIYGDNNSKRYDHFVMGEIISIIKRLNTIEGYISLIKYISDKKERIYMREKNYAIESDINILSSLINSLNRYIIDDLICDEIKRLSIKHPKLVNKYRINNFYN